GGKLLVGAADLEAFVGSGPSRLQDGSDNPNAIGIRVQHINFGLMIDQSTGPDKGKFAFDGSGQAAFLGLSGLGFDDGGQTPASPILGLKLNRTSTAVTNLHVPIIGHSDF